MTAIDILLEHPDFIIVDKPNGVAFNRNQSIDGLFQLVKEQTNLDLWPVHRLDKITSGLVIFAKSSAAAAKFGNMFENKQINKTYLALSDKKPKKKMGRISGDMQTSRGGSWKITHGKENPAITRFVTSALKPGIRLFLVKPETGRTHQIRVALKSLGSPILGDLRYGGSPSDRAYLHAYQLSFNWDNEPITIKCLPVTGELFVGTDIESPIKEMT